MQKFNLDRFVVAQEKSYESAKQEIVNGKKETHWMWYTFPVISGYRNSSMSIKYAISDISEAKAYYKHSILGQRLIELSDIVLGLNLNDAYKIFGPIDALKLQACMTLFYEATRDKVFLDVLIKYFNGESDSRILTLLEKQN